MMRRSIALLFILSIVAAVGRAQVKTVADYLDEVRALANRADVKAAGDYVDRNTEEILREWIAITEINAPLRK
jgi:hypothetical protein